MQLDDRKNQETKYRKTKSRSVSIAAPSHGLSGQTKQNKTFFFVHMSVFIPLFMIDCHRKWGISQSPVLYILAPAFVYVFLNKAE